MGLVTIDVDPGIGAGRKPIGFDELSAVNYQIVKLLIGAAGNFQLLDKDDPATPIPVRLTNGAAFYTASGGGGSTASTDTVQTTPTMGTSSAQILAANANRLAAVVFNPLSVDLVINLKDAAAIAEGVIRIGPRAYWCTPRDTGGVLFTGVINGILASGSGDVTATELIA
jgi:hypothetical protein